MKIITLNGRDYSLVETPKYMDSCQLCAAFRECGTPQMDEEELLKESFCNKGEIPKHYEAVDKILLSKQGISDVNNK